MCLVEGREARALACSHHEHSLEPIGASGPYLSNLPASDPLERHIRALGPYEPSTARAPRTHRACSPREDYILRILFLRIRISSDIAIIWASRFQIAMSIAPSASVMLSA